MMQDVRVTVLDELKARHWSLNDLARRMGGDHAVQQLALSLIFTIDDPGFQLGEDGAADLARAFGTSPELWRNLEAAPPVVPVREAR